MNRQIYFTLVTLFFCLTGLSQGIETGQRETVYSNILKQDREFSIYLPPSYHIGTQQKYPVLYILDGDYNFQYVAGLMELYGGISETIPEMILVAISGKGGTTYKKNCKPDIEGVEDKGNAEEVAEFMEKELIPHIREKFNANDYQVLAGHSIGGLFVINTALERPQLFNHYIAISPALWWEKNAINQVAQLKLEENKKFQSSIYISLADEEGMGVTEFLKIVPENLKESVFHFQQFPEENHNSVGYPTYKWALHGIFADWKYKELYFTSVKEMKAHYQKVKAKYGSVFNVPSYITAYSYYMLQDKPEKSAQVRAEFKMLNANASVAYNTYGAGKLIAKQEFAMAKTLLDEAVALHPKSFEVAHQLAKLALAQDQHEAAKQHIEQALELAQDARQWQINELLETQSSIK